jgi:hypothetical protein
MDTPQTSPSRTDRLTRKQRDVVYARVADDLDTVGADLNSAGSSGDLGSATKHIGRLRALLQLLDEIGWARDDSRDTFEVSIDDEVVHLLTDWRDSIDAILHRQEAVLPEDVDTWHTLDRLLEQVTR